jgi:hypothetical protein
MRNSRIQNGGITAATYSKHLRLIYIIFDRKNNIVLDGKFYFHVMTFSFYQESMKLEVTL